jgi:hypothetical protein
MVGSHQKRASFKLPVEEINDRMYSPPAHAHSTRHRHASSLVFEKPQPVMQVAGDRLDYSLVSYQEDEKSFQES